LTRQGDFNKVAELFELLCDNVNTLNTFVVNVSSEWAMIEKANAKFFDRRTDLAQVWSRWNRRNHSIADSRSVRCIEQRSAVAHSTRDDVFNAKICFISHRGSSYSTLTYFESDKTATCGWNTNGTTAVCGMCGRHDACSNCSTTAAT
jgi:hypothetical protein